MGEEIRRIISNLLIKDIKDPRIRENMVSISAVEVSSDGSYATVYISILGFGKNSFATEEQKKDVLAGFDKAKGMIRGCLGHEMKVRHVPELTFKVDNSLEYGAHMNAVLDALDIKKDEPETEEKDHSAELDDILKDL